MKVLKVVVIVLIVLAVIFFVGGLLLPKTYTVSRSKLINAPPETVYSNVADFNNFLKWNPWTKMEPSAQVTITGVPSQPGHLWKWKGEETGEGQMEIQKVQPNEEIVYILTFTQPYQSIAKTMFTFAPSNEGTMVTWKMTGTGSSTSDRWMFLMMDSMIGKDFDDGLNGLKKISEQNQ